MPRSNVLIVVVDGLRASALGAYGNTTFPTPALDRFAADSLLCDWCYAPAVDLEAIYQSMWRSQHPARFANAGETAGAAAGINAILPARFNESGYRTTLVSDDPNIASFDGANAFQNVVNVIGAGNMATKRAKDIHETELAHLFAAASDVVSDSLEEADAGDDKAQLNFIWVHARGIYGVWDAPLELQEALIDENDPPPIEDVTTPNVVMAADHDPDVAFRYACGYAGQIMMLDACWQALLDVIEAASGDSSWLVMLIGARGFPLGEHGRIGGVDARMYAEQLHVPWLIRIPGGRGRLARESGIVTHFDLWPTLREAVGQGLTNERDDTDGISILQTMNSQSPRPNASTRETLCSVSGSDFAIRSSAWCLRDSVTYGSESQADGPAATPELFVRPDDRWEANDISKLCPDVVDELRAAGIETLQRFATPGF